VALALIVCILTLALPPVLLARPGHPLQGPGAPEAADPVPHLPAEGAPAGAIVPDGAPDPPELTASAAVLVDAASGRVLYAKNAHERRPPASLTKVMTALLCLELVDLEDMVTVSGRAAQAAGSSVWLAEGERHTVRDLLYALVLRSGNDAATALAEHVGGTEDDFVFLMNQRAAALGATDTHFRNPHGLPARGHLSTAADLALITREALSRPGFTTIASTLRYVMPWPGQPWDRALYNENRLLWLYPGADGVKTGWTSEAGRCLIASAVHDGLRLIAVLLDAPEMWADAAQLLDWGFDAFEPVTLYREGTTVGRVRLAGVADRYLEAVTACEVTVALLRGGERVAAVPELPDYVGTPVEAGTELGELRVTVGGRAAGQFPIRAARAATVSGAVGRFFQDLWILLRQTLVRLLVSRDGG